MTIFALPYDRSCRVEGDRFVGRFTLPVFVSFLILVFLVSAPPVSANMVNFSVDAERDHAGPDMAADGNPSVVLVGHVRDTEVRMDVPPDTGATFHQVVFEAPGSSGVSPSTSGRDLREVSTAVPSPPPDYTTALPLLEAGRDTLTVRVWTNQSRHAQFVNLRSDSESLSDSGLPSGIPATPEGKEALARTAVMLEFADESGTILGDFSTTAEIGDSFAYNLRYELSEETMGLFGELGIDTSPGSGAFGFHYADTYGGAWREDTGVEVEVHAGEQSSRVVRVRGLTKDLPGSLAATSTTSDTPGGGAAGTAEECLIGRAAPAAVTTFLRRVRDAVFLERAPGRQLTKQYYSFLGSRRSRPAK